MELDDAGVIVPIMGKFLSGHHNDTDLLFDLNEIAFLEHGGQLTLHFRCLSKDLPTPVSRFSSCLKGIRSGAGPVPPRWRKQPGDVKKAKDEAPTAGVDGTGVWGDAKYGPEKTTLLPSASDSLGQTPDWPIPGVTPTLPCHYYLDSRGDMYPLPPTVHEHVFPVISEVFCPTVPLISDKIRGTVELDFPPPQGVIHSPQGVPDHLPMDMVNASKPVLLEPLDRPPPVDLPPIPPSQVILLIG